MIRLFVLGPADARGDDGESVDAVVAQPKRFALLSYLVAESARGPRRRDELLALFWPELTPARARRALTYALYFLRRELGREVIVRHGADDLAVDLSLVWSDVAAFEAACDDGRLPEALALYRGDFMEGFYDADAVELEQWADARRLRLRERARTAAWTLVEQARVNGAPGDGVRWARRALELAPDDERAMRELLVFLHAVGDLAGAVAEHEYFVKRYRELHGSAPAPQVATLLDELRASPVPVPARVSTPVRPADTAAPPDRQASPSPKQRSRRAGMLATLGALTVISAIGLAYAFARTPAPALSSAVVAVLPFAYHGPTQLGYTSEGVTTLLAAGLDRLGDVRAVNPRLLLEGVHKGDPSAEDAITVARRYGAGAAVVGDITAAGGRLRVTATLYDDHAHAVAGPVEAEGIADSLFEIVDRLAAQLAAARPGGAATPFSSAAAKGTRSLAAFRAFVDGERAFRMAQYDVAIAAYQQAVAADSGFALAMLRMSQAANWTGDYRLQTMADDRLQRFIDRLAPRDRVRAAAWHLSMTSPSPAPAESLYRTLVRDDPTDVEAWYYLADLVYHQGPAVGWPAAESRPAWEHVLALEPNDASAVIHLARLVAAQADRATFDSLARRGAALNASEDLSFELRALRAFGFGSPADRDATARAFSERPMKFAVAYELGGHLAGVSPDADGLDRIWIAIGKDVPAPDALGLVLLQRASVALARGRVRVAGALIDSARASSPSMGLRYQALASTMGYLPAYGATTGARLLRARTAIERGDTIALSSDAPAWRTFTLGMIAVRRGNGPSAARYSQALDALAARGGDAELQLAPLLRGEVAALNDRPAEALAALGPVPTARGWHGDAGSGLANAENRWIRAELLARVGRAHEALRLLASIPESTGNDIAYAPAARLREGELLEQLGDRMGAAAQFRRALAYWPDADEEIRPLVERARRGLERTSVERMTDPK